MKVLFFLLDADPNASTRLRATQFFPLLRAEGIEPHACPPVPPAVERAIARSGLAGLPGKAVFYGAFFLTRLVAVLRAARYDVVVIQRDLFPFGPPLLERLLRRVNPRIVFDTDDAVYLRPSFTPDNPYQRFRWFGKAAEVARHARAVTVASRPIAAWASQHNPNVHLLPIVLDPAPYQAALDRRPAREDGRIVVGWTGTAGSLPYLADLAPVLAGLARRWPIVVRVVSGAYRSVDLPGVPVDARPWRPETHLDDIAGCDIGLVPLWDEPFERQKFPSKMLQYLALDVPVVAARIGTAVDVLTDGVNGLLAGSPGEWKRQIERLIREPDLRARLGAAGRATFLAHYTVDRTAPRLAEILRQAAA